MATTPEDLKKNDSDFADAFNAETPARAEPTEDEAFGLDIKSADQAPADVKSEEPAQGLEDKAADGQPVEAVVVVADGDAMQEAAGEAAAEATAAEASESQSQENADDEPTDPKEIQRKKSWEGRLKAEEARLAKVREELEAKAAAAGKPAEEAAGDALEEVADQAQAAGDAEMASKVEQVADKVEDGEISVEEAMTTLSQDFGEPFVKMITAIAKSVARETAGGEIGEIKQKTSDIIDHLKSTAAKVHFGAIQAAHPDFVEISEDPAFQEWRDADAERSRIASSGTADEINAMLTQWKDQAGGSADPAAEEVAVAGAESPAGEPAADSPEMAVVDDAPSDDDIDAAEGVRSAGMQLPEEPSTDYAGAWQEFEEADRRSV